VDIIKVKFISVKSYIVFVIALLATIAVEADCICKGDAELKINAPDIICLGEPLNVTTDGSHCGWQQKYPGRISGPDSPCNDCVLCTDCKIDLNVPTITGPGNYVISATLFSSCANLNGSHMLTVVSSNSEWPNWSLGGELSISGDVGSSINEILKPAGIEIDVSVKATTEYRERDCCISGNTEKEIKGSVSANLSGSKSWGPKYEVRAGSDVCSVSFKAWATIEVSADVTVSAEATRKIDCSNEDKTRFSVGPSAELTATASAGFEACKSLCSVEDCSEASITPAKISASANAYIEYENGVKQATASLGCIKFIAEIDVGPFNHNWETELAGNCGS